MRLLFKISLSLSSIMFLGLIYLVKEGIWLIPSIGVFSTALYIIVIVIWTLGCLLLTNYLSSDTVENEPKSIEPVNDSFLPIYLGYFFVGLSINSLTTLIIIAIIIIVFLICSQRYYFNPIFLLFRYQYYKLTDNNGMVFFIITRQEIKSTKNLKFEKLKRINNYTYIDRS